MIPSLAFAFSLVAAASAACQDSAYTQIGGGDCFKVYELERNYYDAQMECWADDGDLASVQNSIEDQGIAALIPKGKTALIGLFCVSAEDCRWDDWTPYNYTAFIGGLSDWVHGKDCAVVNATDGMWYSASCVETQSAFICRMKSVTTPISCGDYTAYSGFCVKAKPSLRTAIAAEADCVAEGGHLINIDYTKNNIFYQGLLIRNNISGAVHIGLYYKDGKFQWTDGSMYGTQTWAESYPNISLGYSVQMIVSNELSWTKWGQWKNGPISEPHLYICKRPQHTYTPTLAPLSCPELQHFDDAGTIYSPGFPVSIPPRMRCQYLLTGKAGTTVQVQFPVLFTDVWSSLSLYDGMDTRNAIAILWGNVGYTKKYNSTGNILKMDFETGNVITEGQGWQAIFTTTTANDPITVTSTLPSTSASHGDATTAEVIRTATLTENRSTTPVKLSEVPIPATTTKSHSNMRMGNIAVFAALMYLSILFSETSLTMSRI